MHNIKENKFTLKSKLNILLIQKFSLPKPFSGMRSANPESHWERLLIMPTPPPKKKKKHCQLTDDIEPGELHSNIVTLTENTLIFFFFF